MESFLCTNIPVQMISFTDINGTITPMRFRFTDKDGERVTVNIEKIVSTDRAPKKIGTTYECTATFYGTVKRFYLYYSSFSGVWSISKIGQ